ncbi:DUF3105 domain-containing protein [Streptomyces sp. NBC_01283]|uniref:DUF3105 domain-containing protein n=1 Tax=Streptomyces sp. NBC_01283 TaxID=2903812 RepID=UPI00352D1367|nr:DUF3105 domain-containing protein [Streptomyces sp. NBC_01283]
MTPRHLCRFLIIIAAVTFAVFAAVGLLLRDKESAPPTLVKGERTWSGLTRNHVTTKVSYPMNPPVGGDHHPVWLNCDAKVYTKQVPNEHAVHSLEHGAVWVSYNDEASPRDVQRLSKKVSATPYSFMSPYKSQDAPIILTAWGHQLKLDTAFDRRFGEFMEKYVLGEQTQERGSPCADGITP